MPLPAKNKTTIIKTAALSVVSGAWLALAGCQTVTNSPSTVTTTPLYEASHDAQGLQVVTDQKLCDDFLALMGQKTPELEFVGCSAGFYEDHHAIIANYKVAGNRAFAVQEHLHRISGMPRMVKDCCIWESIDKTEGKMGGVIYDGSERYFVRMQSDELRLGWNISSDVDRINSFRVQVIYPLNQYGFDSNRFAGATP